MAKLEIKLNATIYKYIRLVECCYQIEDMPYTVVAPRNTPLWIVVSAIL